MFRSRILVTVLALWGLAMIVPDLVRVMNPLGSWEVVGGAAHGSPSGTTLSQVSIGMTEWFINGQ